MARGALRLYPGSPILAWLAVGCALGFIDGTAGPLADREVAGLLLHRLSTLIVSGALGSLLFLLVGVGWTWPCPPGPAITPSRLVAAAIA
jgi:hypothetical protein